MVKASKLNLLNYVRIHGTDEDIHVELLVPFTNWPEALYSKYGWMVRVLTSLQSSDELLEFSQRVAFCRDVLICPSKTGTDDNPACPRNALGICCDASFLQNDGTIPLQGPWQDIRIFACPHSTTAGRGDGKVAPADYVGPVHGRDV